LKSFPLCESGTFGGILTINEEEKQVMRNMGIVLLIFLIMSCATTVMEIEVTRPAEVNLKGFDKIAIGDIKPFRNHGDYQRHASDVSDEVTTVLFNSGKYEVLDREHIRGIIAEHKLGNSGFVDENTASELGQFIGAAVFLYGNIQRDEYKEETSRDDWKDKEGGRHYTNHRKGVYNLSVNFKMVDIETAKIIAIKTLTTGYQKKTKGHDEKAPKIDDKDLYRLCLTSISSQFIKLVAPYKVTVQATFQTDKLLPEVDQAMVQFKIGEWDEGLTLLRGTTEKTGL